MHDLLAPVVALVAWTHVMWLWMYATRIPAMQRVKMQLDASAPRGAQMATLPAPVRWKADNYNHLMEQPTLFYAIAIVLAIIDPDRLNQGLAWAYVGSRVVHSLVQVLTSKVLVRFALFVIGSLVLIVMTARAAWVLG